MASRKKGDPLNSVLNHVEEELADNVARVCNAANVQEESTQELEKLSETLLDASRQARAAAGLRRRMSSRDVRANLTQALGELGPPRI